MGPITIESRTIWSEFFHNYFFVTYCRQEMVFRKIYENGTLFFISVLRLGEFLKCLALCLKCLLVLLCGNKYMHENAFIFLFQQFYYVFYFKFYYCFFFVYVYCKILISWKVNFFICNLDANTVRIKIQRLRLRQQIV